MTALRNILIATIALATFLILAWLFAVPNDLIREKIEDAVAQSGNNSISLSVEGLQKGIFFSLSAHSLNIQLDNRPALKITDVTSNLTPRYLSGGQPAVAIEGKIGTGDVKGVIKLPVAGTIKIERAELGAIPYLTQFGMNITGNVSSDINIQNDRVDITFEIPDLLIDDSTSVIPLLNTFRKLQGSLSVRGNTIHVTSVSLEGEKGFARLKGTITSNVMDLALELMPEAGKLNTMESMLIGKHIVSPGYYVVPVEGPLPE